MRWNTASCCRMAGPAGCTTAARSSPTLPASRLRALGAVRDVTGRRAAEDALREGEARLRLAQEAGGIGSWDLDLASGRQVWLCL